LVVANVRERLAVSKRMVKKMDVERFILKQLNEEEVKEKHQVPAELIQAGVGEYCFLRYINLLCWWNKE
jgi:hypothetical protein